MKIENGDECAYICDNCEDEIVGAPIQHGDRQLKHFCSSFCAMKWLRSPAFDLMDLFEPAA